MDRVEPLLENQMVHKAENRLSRDEAEDDVADDSMRKQPHGVAASDLQSQPDSQTETDGVPAR